MTRALIIVDVQNDFLPGGALAVPEGNQIIPVINRLQSMFDIVVATQDWHPADHQGFVTQHKNCYAGEKILLNGIQHILWPVHCVQHTHGAALASKLVQGRIQKIIYKGTHADVDSYSAFFDNARIYTTQLHDWLQHRQITELYFCGLAIEYCVKYSVLDACSLGYQTYVIQDACRGIELQPGDMATAWKEMTLAGAHIVSSVEVGGKSEK